MKQRADELTKLLGALEKEAFEEEVCAFLLRGIVDFQTVPAKPHGDAGLDGLSHDQCRAYCCYGPEQAPFKANNAGLKDDIIRKFKSDLHSLFELEHVKRKLVHRNNGEMSTILQAGRKITHVYLVVSVFDSHRVIGPLKTAFEECKKKSKLRYVDASATMNVLGPKEIVALGQVDDHVLMRVQERAVAIRIGGVLGSTPAPVPASSASVFDDKFDWLERQPGTVKGGIQPLRDHFRKRWAYAIALENDLANNAVGLHQRLGQLREQAKVDARLQSLGSAQPAEVISKMRTALTKRVDETFGHVISPQQRDDLGDGELGRLVGVCDIDWRKP